MVWIFRQATTQYETSLATTDNHKVVRVRDLCTGGQRADKGNGERKACTYELSGQVGPHVTVVQESTETSKIGNQKSKIEDTSIKTLYVIGAPD
jgi:5-deoxy-D-glucuronate isomerase